MSNTINSEVATIYSEKAPIMYLKGDSLNELKNIPSCSVDLIITSPPYNVGKEYEVKESIESYLESQREIIDELTRVLSDTGSLCWQVGNYIDKGEVFPLDIYYYQIFKNIGLKLRNRIVWKFGHGLHAKKRFSGRYETILWFTKSDTYTFNLDPVRIPQLYPGKTHYKGEKRGQPSGNPKGKNPSDIWELLITEWEDGILDIPNVKANHIEKTEHPCQYPVELVERFILALTNKGDLVLDPYAGVASTLIAAMKNDRSVIGIEREDDYIKIGLQRIKAQLMGSLKTRQLGKKVHKPTGKEKVSSIPEEWKKEAP